MQAFLILSMIWLGYLVIVRPFEQTKILVFEIVNELVVLAIGYHCLSQLLIENDAWARVYVGYSQEYILLIQLAANISAVTSIRSAHFYKWARYRFVWYNHHRKLRIAERIRRLERERLRLEKIEAKKRKLHEAMIRNDKEAKGLIQPTKKDTKNLQLQAEEQMETEREDLLAVGDSQSDLTEEEELLPPELQEFTVGNQEANPLMELMKQKLEENKMR